MKRRTGKWMVLCALILGVCAGIPVFSARFPSDGRRYLAAALSVSSGEETKLQYGSRYVSWEQVRDRIANAPPDGIVYVDASAYESIPAYVLNTLKNRDVTLALTWEGETFYLYGRALAPIENAAKVSLSLSELSRLYPDEPPTRAMRDIEDDAGIEIILEDEVEETDAIGPFLPVSPNGEDIEEASAGAEAERETDEASAGIEIELGPTACPTPPPVPPSPVPVKTPELRATPAPTVQVKAPIDTPAPTETTAPSVSPAVITSPILSPTPSAPPASAGPSVPPSPSSPLASPSPAASGEEDIPAMREDAGKGESASVPLWVFFTVCMGLCLASGAAIGVLVVRLKSRP